jgi:Myb-like DNA-binding domain
VISRLASIAESCSHPHTNFPSNKDRADKADPSVPLESFHQQHERAKASVPTTPRYRVVPSKEVSLDVNASSGVPVSINQGVLAATKTPLSTTPSCPTTDHQNDVETTPSSVQGDRRVVKAGRRFLSSLSAIAQWLSDDADEAARSVGKKRIADDAASSLAQPAKVSRRSNMWALKQRKKLQLNATDFSRKDAYEINKVSLFNETGKESEHTPCKLASGKAVVVEDDEGNIVRSSLPRSPSSSSIKRHPFTEDEVNAILEGVKLHGVGHWTVIQESDERLANRKPGQLKDKYRTMINRGEI